MEKNNKDVIQINLEENLFLVESIFSENSVDIDIKNLEDKRIIDKILSKMDSKYKDVLILKFLEQKDYKEISDILEKPMGSVATLLNRAKNLLKKNLKRLKINKIVWIIKA